MKRCKMYRWAICRKLLPIVIMSSFMYEKCVATLLDFNAKMFDVEWEARSNVF